MKCENVDRLITDYSVGNLFGRVELEIREHLDDCPECARELDRLHLIMAALEEEMAEIDPPRGLWHGVHHRITSDTNPSWQDRIGSIFQRPRRLIAVGIGSAALASALIFGLSIKSPEPAAAVLEPAAVEYIQNHASSASGDAFADRVSLGFVASMSTDAEHEHL